MRVVVAIEARFEVAAGQAYSSYLTYDSFWRRYLDVFDSVLIIARGREAGSLPQGHQLVTGAGVELLALPSYRGPYQFAAQMFSIRRMICKALRQDDACILRVPGTIGTEVWRHLQPQRPFGVEVFAIPWDGFAPGVVKGVLRPFWRRLFHYYLKKQCRQAVAAAYVTERAIQRLYPPNETAFTTNYSSVELDSSNICPDASRRLAEIRVIPARLKGDGPPVRLGFIGSFSLGHKRPDLHIRAVAQCVEQGANVVFEMIGDGSELAEMKALARRLGVAERVMFRGRIPGGKPIFDALDSFDLFIHATATEGLPRVVIEAMARGCPCIGTNIGGIPELIEPSFLVPPFDWSALAQKIMEVLTHTEKMTAAVSRNIDHTRKYCRGELTPRRRALYKALRERTEQYLASRNKVESKRCASL
jgi:glycosyltransferase involved in cell wall biosynthesis